MRKNVDFIISEEERMKNVLREEYIILNEKFENYNKCIEKIVNLLKKHGDLKDGEKLIEEIKHRESIMTTYCGGGLALPHVISDNVSTPIIVICTCSGVVWNEEMDRADIIILIAIPKQIIENNYDMYEESINSILEKLSDDYFRQKIRNAKNKREIIKIINK